jgi:hypothetical protein
MSLNLKITPIFLNFICRYFEPKIRRKNAFTIINEDGSRSPSPFLNGHVDPRPFSYNTPSVFRRKDANGNLLPCQNRSVSEIAVHQTLKPKTGIRSKTRESSMDTNPHKVLTRTQQGIIEVFNQGTITTDRIKSAKLVVTNVESDDVECEEVIEITADQIETMNRLFVMKPIERKRRSPTHGRMVSS